MDIFPYRLNSANLTGFDLFSRISVANTVTFFPPMYHYIMLVICCSKLLLEVYKKRASKGSRPIASSEHTICFARKKMTDNKLAIGKGDVFIVSYRAIHS